MLQEKMSADKVKSIAKLIKLELSDQEVEKFRVTIPQALDVVDVLKELDTDNMLATSSVTGLTNVFQDGSMSGTLTQDLALSNAAEVSKGLFVTKAVFDRL